MNGTSIFEQPLFAGTAEPGRDRMRRMQRPAPSNPEAAERMNIKSKILSSGSKSVPACKYPHEATSNSFRYQVGATGSMATAPVGTTGTGKN
jgi:hypothetical protein